MQSNLWARDIAAAADYCREHFPHSAEKSIALADKILKNSFIFRDHWEMERTVEPVEFTGEINWAHIPAGDPEWLYAMNRHTSFVNLGKAYRYTGDIRYFEKFAALISDWIDRVPLTEKSSGDTWRSLEAGLRCEYWLRSILLFEGAAAITEELKQKIEKSLLQHAEYLIKASGQFQRLSNWGVLQDHGLFLLGVYFKNQGYISLALERLNSELRLQVFDDGSHWEQSPMYHCEVLHCAIDTVLLARGNGIQLPDGFERTVHSMCTALAMWLKPDGRLVCQSDSDDTDARDIVAEGAILFSDGYLCHVAGEKLFEENIWDIGVEALDFYCRITPQKPRLPSTALPDSGNYMLRSTNNPDAVFLHMHCGCLGSGHGHADLLHIDLSALGEDVLIDSGRYTYVNTPLRRELKLPAAHNTVRVDGVDFSECIDSWGYKTLATPLKGEYKFTRNIDFISGSHLGYMKLPGGPVLVTRRVVFLKPGLFVIADTFTAVGRHSYEHYFHFGEGETKQLQDGAIWRGRNIGLLIKNLDGASLSLDNAPYSTDYNSLKTGKVLSSSLAREGDFTSLWALGLLPGGIKVEYEIERVPVYTARLGGELPADLAEGIRIRFEGEECIVIFAYKEVISEVGTLSCCGRDGYGRVIAFTSEHEDGITLNW